MHSRRTYLENQRGVQLVVSVLQRGYDEPYLQNCTVHTELSKLPHGQAAMACGLFVRALLIRR